MLAMHMKQTKTRSGSPIGPVRPDCYETTNFRVTVIPPGAFQTYQDPHSRQHALALKMLFQENKGGAYLRHMFNVFLTPGFSERSLSDMLSVTQTINE